MAGIFRNSLTPQEALRNSEAHFRLLTENVSDIVWRVDADYRFTYMSPADERLRGYKADEVIGQHVFEVFDDDGISVVSKLAEKHLEAAKKGIKIGTARFEARHRCKDGSWIWAEVSAMPEQNEDGAITGYFGITREITERKRAEEEKARLEEQLQQSQKMESVGRLAGGVAHDFNNMLGVIIGYAEMALMKLDPSQPFYNNFREISSAASRSADLTRQLLAFARKQTIAPKVIDLNETVTGMLKMLQRLIGEDIHLTWQPAPELWKTRVDPSQIDQLLANLCVNARDAITDVGRITIETENCVFGSAYSESHSYVEPGEYVQLVVSDNGIGMDKETQSHIFEPFFTTKGVGEGTGLGLATVYGIIKQNNGFIDVHSEPGHGTTFTIYLPRHTGKSGETPDDDAAKPLPCGNETILLVEDEPTILKMAAMMLEVQGYTVLKAGTAAEAIRQFKENVGKIKLLMTDVIMPDMNGRDLTTELQSLDPLLKCLFMSGYTANVIAHHGVLDEGVNFIQKPFSLPDLATRVREVLEN